MLAMCAMLSTAGKWKAWQAWWESGDFDPRGQMKPVHPTPAAGAAKLLDEIWRRQSGMFDFKKQRKAVERLIKERLDPICSANGYVWTRHKYGGNHWDKTLSWCKKSCALTIHAVGMTKKPEYIGGASIVLPQYYDAIRREDWPDDVEIGFGGPVHWIDERLADMLRFENWDQLVALLPLFERALVECVLPELERYTDESVLFDILLRPDWYQTMKIPGASADRRGALVTLMMAKRDGKNKAVAWGEAEAERIKAEQPYVTSTKYYQEILRALDYLRRKNS
jgi:hypothetical protein